MKIIGKKGYDANLALSGEKVAYYHLPGLFEFYELYRVFLPLFRMHREYFYDWCEIGPYMEHLRTVSGAEGEPRLERPIRGTF